MKTPSPPDVEKAAQIGPARTPEALSTESEFVAEWVRVCSLKDLPTRGGRQVQAGDVELALFRTSHDGVLAVENRCPHRGGGLSEGILTDHYVVCPLHSWKIDLLTGSAVSPDRGCIERFPVDLRGGEVFVNLAREAYRAHADPIEDVTGVHPDSKRPKLGRRRAEASDFTIQDFTGELPVLAVEPPSPDTEESLRLGIDWDETHVELSLDDLRTGFDVVEAPTHLSCLMFGFSKRVKWRGVRLVDVLSRLGIPEFPFASFFSWDTDSTREKTRFFETLKRDYFTDPRTLLAFGLNEEPLPKVHGGPLRLVVPFLQGYKSVKWLTRVKLCHHDEVGYKKQYGFIEFPELHPPSNFEPTW